MSEGRGSLPLTEDPELLIDIADDSAERFYEERLVDPKQAAISLEAWVSALLAIYRLPSRPSRIERWLVLNLIELGHVREIASRRGDPIAELLSDPDVDSAVGFAKSNLRNDGECGDIGDRTERSWDNQERDQTLVVAAKVG